MAVTLNSNGNRWMVHTCDCDAGHKESQSDESISPEPRATLNCCSVSPGKIYNISSLYIIPDHHTMLTNKKGYYCCSLVRASHLLAPVKVLVIIQTIVLVSSPHPVPDSSSDHWTCVMLRPGTPSVRAVCVVCVSLPDRLNLG